ncbi:MAG: ABC transporter permease [Pseudomonadota bacterium]|nr:ABC transporter permease [Pseudomonadota bacterium]
MLIRLAVKSLLQRKTAALLIILAISLSMSALLLTRSLSSELKNSFNSSVSGTDLIVGARSHPLQVLLYSVFRLGNPTQAVSAGRWQEIQQLPQLSWSFPIALGDSHHGFAVLGTNDDYFRYFRYGNKHPLENSAGGGLTFTHVNDVIIGATVARKLGYHIGDELFLSHGTHATSFHVHKEIPFRVSAILKPTGTPVDRSLHVHLAMLEAVHNESWLHAHQLAHHHEDDHGHDMHEQADDDHDHASMDEHDEDHDHHAHDAAEHDHEEHDHASMDEHDEDPDHHAHDAAEHDHGEHDHASMDDHDEDHDHHAHDAAEHDHGEHDHAGMDEHDEDPDHHAHDAAEHEHTEHSAAAIDHIHFADLPAPGKVSAVFVGLKSRPLTFQVRELLNAPDQEPLTAVIPGVALSEFWQLLANAENILQVLSALMLITGLLGTIAMLQVSVAFRRREISLLRLIGAHPLSVFTLLELEVLLLTASGWLLALLISGLTQTLAAPLLADYFSLVVSPQWWPQHTHWLILISLVLSVIAGLIPALSAYRVSRNTSYS